MTGNTEYNIDLRVDEHRPGDVNQVTMARDRSNYNESSVYCPTQGTTCASNSKEHSSRFKVRNKVLYKTVSFDWL